MAALQALSADNLVVLSRGADARIGMLSSAPRLRRAASPLVRVSSKCRPPRDDNGGGYCPNSEPSVAPARTLTAATGDVSVKELMGLACAHSRNRLGLPIGNCAVGSALGNEEKQRLVVSLAKDSQHCWIKNIERTTNELENLTP